MLSVSHSVCRGLYPGNITNCTVFETFSNSDFTQQVAPLELSKQEHKSNLQNIQVSKIIKLFFFTAVLIQVAKTLSNCALVVVDDVSRIYPIYRLASSPSCCDWLCVMEATGYFPPVVYMATGFLFLTLCCSDLALKRRTSSPTVSEDSSTPKNTPA